MSEAAHDWQHRFSGDAGALLAGARLIEADDFAAAHADQMTDLERRFLDASRAQRSAATRVRHAPTRTRRGRLRDVVVAVRRLIGALLGRADPLGARAASGRADRPAIARPGSIPPESIGRESINPEVIHHEQ